MMTKIKTILIILFYVLMCIFIGTSIITNCQKIILQNSLSQTIKNQDEINDKLSELLSELSEESKLEQNDGLTQTEVALTDDGTTVICYKDDKGNEYIKFGDNPIERVME